MARDEGHRTTSDAGNANGKSRLAINVIPSPSIDTYLRMRVKDAEPDNDGDRTATGDGFTR